MPRGSWHYFCPHCDAKALEGLTPGGALPYQRACGLLVTLNDSESCRALRLGDLEFSAKALEAAFQQVIADGAGPKTQAVLEARQKLQPIAAAQPKDALTFSQAVCAWGGGTRVFSKMMAAHPGRGEQRALGEQILAWLARASQNDCSVREAITLGAAIHGLGVSFASKHLRMFLPGRYVTLDEIIAAGVGYAPTAAGYSLFMTELLQLRERLNMRDPRWDRRSAGDLENAIFYLARQIVRSEPAASQRPGAKTAAGAAGRRRQTAASRARASKPAPARKNLAA